MSINDETLERIHQQLREATDIGGNVPQDLFSHLTEVFNRIVLHHQDDAYEKFEEISALIKQTDLNFNNPQRDSDLNAAGAAQAVSERDMWVRKSKNLLSEVNDLVSANDSSLLSTNKTFQIPDLAEEAEMLEWAGVSFGEDNIIRLQKSIKVIYLLCRQAFALHYLNLTVVYFIFRDWPL